MIGRRGARVAIALLVTALAACSADTSPGASPGRRGDAGIGTRSRSSRIEPWLTRDATADPQTIAADDEGVVALGRRGDVIAYDSAGDMTWRLDAGPDTTTTRDPIALGEEIVLVLVHDTVAGTGVRALDRADGRVRWEVASPDPRAAAVGRSPGGPVVVAVVGGSGALSLLDAADGSTRALVPLGFEDLSFDPSVEIDGGVIVVSWLHDGISELRAVDLATGTTSWTLSNALLSARPAIADGLVLVVENTRIERDVFEAAVRGLELASGAEAWSTPVAGPFVPTLRVAVSDDLAAFVDVRGRVTAIEPRTGSVRWVRATRRRQLEASPWIVRDVVAMTTYGTGLVAIAADDGRSVDNEVPGPVQTAMTIEDSTAAGGSLLLLVRRPAGEGEIWWLGPSDLPAGTESRPEEREGLPATLTLDSEEPSGATGISHPRITPGSR